MPLPPGQYDICSTLPHSWFRLITILPGKAADKICVERMMHSLAEAPPYDAISYTWGSTDVGLQTIECNKSDFVITKNLFEALKRFRHESESRIMWADALCINQESMEECNQQISIMIEIYSQARQVCIWLGEHVDDPDLTYTFSVAGARHDYAAVAQMITAPAGPGNLLCLYHPDPFYHQVIAAARQRFSRPEDVVLLPGQEETIAGIEFDDLLSLLGTRQPTADTGQIENTDTFIALRPNFDRSHAQNVLQQDFDSFSDFLLEVMKSPAERNLSDDDNLRVVRSLHQLFQKPYWTRAWIVQELIVSEEATLFCGKCEIDFAVFGSVYGLDRRKNIRNFFQDDLRIYDPDENGAILLRLLLEDSSGVENFTNILGKAHTAFSQLSYDRLAVRTNMFGRTTLGEVLVHYGSQQAQDPRDIIFSLLNTLRAYASNDGDIAWAKKFADYNLSKRQVYIAVATRIVEGYRRVVSNGKALPTMDIFNFAHAMHLDGSQIPSWVPEWDRQPSKRPSFTFRRIGEIHDMVPYKAFVEQDKLTIAAHIVDVVASGVDVLRGSDNMLDEVDLFLRLERKGFGERYGSADGHFDAFWRTIIADDVLGERDRNDLTYDFSSADEIAVTTWLQHCRMNYAHLQRIWADKLPQRKQSRNFNAELRENLPDAQLDTGASEWTTRNLELIRMPKGSEVIYNLEASPDPVWMARQARLGHPERKFVTTATGFFAQTIRDVQPDDVLALVAGSIFPVWLRPLENGNFTFLGLAWVCGLMYQSDKYYETWDAMDVRNVTIE